MRYTLEQAQADESLPLWWTEKGCPDWARVDDFRNIPPDLQVEVRYGLPEVILRKRLQRRKWAATHRAKKAAELAAATPEQKAERARMERAAKVLSRLTSAVKMRTRMVAEAIEAKQQRCLTTLCEWHERTQLERAQQALNEYVDDSLRDELARLGSPHHDS